MKNSQLKPWVAYCFKKEAIDFLPKENHNIKEVTITKQQNVH